MPKQTTESTAESRVTWNDLETCLRSKMREWLQELLEAEMDELLGRRKSERRQAVDAAPGYRSGHGKPRRLTLCNGTVTLRRPRVRGLQPRFESRLLPLFARRTPEVNALLPELYLHGLALGDFDLALRGLLGEEAPLSATTVARLKAQWDAERQQWASRSLADLQVVYLWVDGVYVKAGLEREKAAVLVVLAGLSDGRKELLALVPGHRESTESWSDVLRDLKARGLSAPKLVVGDGHLGIWAGLRNVYPEAKEQRCWNHRLCNALDKVPKTRQAHARLLLTQIPYAATQQEAERLKAVYQHWCRQQGLEAAALVLDRDWERMLTFYQFPKAHWIHLRTSNPIESPFAALRLRTDAAKRFKQVENATAVIWKMLLVAQGRFRRLNAPELLAEVYHGVTFVNGVRVMERAWEVAA
ncbi:IS256 family transposase [Candidatus Methylomirabilis limnetica]|uniref:Mutator family transposase n=1 Tax=Candidatus Methylomirabilis limnetica TaxID=2033718 RepID=A0A2T4U010_9BACT|nr:IS256 family transposase [Candidatus Methylomirabilis limnetica]PTL36672.1 IS256 family transposase [Candidatus Methylomirabilis limnetica]